MAAISFESKGSFKRTDAFLERMKRDEIFSALSKYGEQGVAALAAATPSSTGETANSWYYTVSKKPGSYSLIWHNRHVDENGVSVAVLIQYGHATGTGGYVQGRDFINPAIRPIFDQIATEVWKAVTKA
jgi:hypothetical protein